MAVTLVEAAKKFSGEDIRRSVIEVFARQSDILAVMPFDTISGNSLRYNQEEILPGIGFRGVNEGYTEGTGVLNPVVEPLVIAGGDLDVDKFIITTMGADQRSAQEVMKIKALVYNWTLKFLKGDSTTDQKEFDGLQTRLTGAQIITQTAAGLSLFKLDETIDQVVNPTHIICNKTMRRRLTQAARDTTVGGHINFTQDSFGRRQTTYNDLPLLIADEDNTGTQILPFTEPSSSTSIYVVSFGESRLQGIQSGPIDVRDLGEQDAKPVLRTRVEWYVGITIWHPKAAARYELITDAAIVA